MTPEGLAKTVSGFGVDRISTSNNCQFCANKLNCLRPWFTLFYFIESIFMIQNIRNAIVIYDFLKNVLKLNKHEKMCTCMTKWVRFWHSDLDSQILKAVGIEWIVLHNRIACWTSRRNDINLNVCVLFRAVPIWISLHKFGINNHFRLHFQHSAFYRSFG